MKTITLHTADRAAMHLESLINTAHVAGLFLRFPERFNAPYSPADAVAYACKNLDQLGINFTAQNAALFYINDIDTQATWNKLYSNQFPALALKCLTDNYTIRD